MIDVRSLGARGDGKSHPLSQSFSNLKQAQSLYPFVTSLTQELDWAVIQSAINSVDQIGSTCTVLIPTGGYVVSDPIRYTRLGVQIQGEGKPCVASGLEGYALGTRVIARKGFAGDCVIDVSPQAITGGANFQWVYGQGLSNVCVDVTDCPAQLAIRIQAGSNFPVWHDVAVTGNVGTALKCEPNPAVGAAFCEGLTFHNFHAGGGRLRNGSCSGYEPLYPAVWLVSCNETLFLGGKVLYSYGNGWNYLPMPVHGDHSDVPAFLISTTPDGVNGSQAITFSDMSTTSYAVHYRADDCYYAPADAWLKPNWVLWRGCTLENFNRGIEFRTNSHDAHPNSGAWLSQGTSVSMGNRFQTSFGPNPRKIVMNHTTGGFICADNGETSATGAMVDLLADTDGILYRIPKSANGVAQVNDLGKNNTAL
jgi:hypothetical protein